MTANNYLHNKGDMLVYPGGGSAAEVLPLGEAGQVIVANPSASNGLGLEWQNAPTAATSGTFTFSSGTHAQIPLASVTAGSVIAYTIKTLGTVTVAQAISTVLEAGVGFTPSSASASDTSTINWALVG